MYDANDTTISMPDLDCPAWCTADHADHWAQCVAVTQWSGTIPKNDGTVIIVTPKTGRELDESLRRLFEPTHARTVWDLDLNESERESASIEIMRGVDGQTTLYVDAQGALTATKARQFAAGLLDAADALDTITGRQTP